MASWKNEKSLCPDHRCSRDDGYKKSGKYFWQRHESKKGYGAWVLNGFAAYRTDKTPQGAVFAPNDWQCPNLDVVFPSKTMPVLLVPHPGKARIEMANGKNVEQPMYSVVLPDDVVRQHGRFLCRALHVDEAATLLGCRPIDLKWCMSEPAELTHSAVLMATLDDEPVALCGTMRELP